MEDTLKIIRFQSPWQGRKGYTKFKLSLPTGTLQPHKCISPHKMVRKCRKNIDGLLMRPIWPSRKGACLFLKDGQLHLHAVRNNFLDPQSAPVNLTGSEFQAFIKERIFYRQYVFDDGQNRMTMSDMSGRLISPPRTAFEVFPTTDYSAFGRLIQILTEPSEKQRLIEDLGNRRFNAPLWVEPSKLDFKSA